MKIYKGTTPKTIKHFENEFIFNENSGYDDWIFQNLENQSQKNNQPDACMVPIIKTFNVVEWVKVIN